MPSEKYTKHLRNGTKKPEKLRPLTLQRCRSVSVLQTFGHAAKWVGRCKNQLWHSRERTFQNLDNQPTLGTPLVQANVYAYRSAAERCGARALLFAPAFSSLSLASLRLWSCRIALGFKFSVSSYRLQRYSMIMRIRFSYAEILSDLRFQNICAH